MANSNSSPPTHIAVLLAGVVQLLDVSPIDLFSMLTPEYLTACQLPASLISDGVPMTITYVSEAGAPSICELTASAGLRVTAGLDDPSVAPGEVDILLIPGPDPREVPSEPVLKFVKAHTEKDRCVVMTVCTGVFVAGYAGILTGRAATGPRGLLITGELQKKFPEVKWVDRRWVKDGNVWCSAGITNGLDMVAAYMRDTWPGPATNAVLAMADVGDRNVEFDSSRAVEGAWFGWQVLKALVMGKRR